MSKPRRAAIYARISDDPEGDRAGVERQIPDCQAWAKRNDWNIITTYEDDDRSAYGRRARPAYQRLLTDIEAGTIDGVIVWHHDRLHRQPREFEDFIDRATAAGIVSDVRMVTGDVDLGEPTGLLLARMLIAGAAYESHHKSERITRERAERASQGRPTALGRRGYGYTSDRLSIIEDEAAVIRDLVERFLAGENLRSLTLWLNEHSIPTVTGVQWRPSTVRTLLQRPAIAGLLEHRGQVVGPGSWPAIISEEDHRRVLSILQAQSAQGRRAPRVNLLTGGLLVCGRCEQALHGATRKGKRRYECLPQPYHSGCGRLTILAQPVEDLIRDAVLYRLDSPAMTDALSGRGPRSEHLAQATDEAKALRARSIDLAQMFASGDITRSEWLAAKEALEARQAAVQERIDTASHDVALRGLPGTGSQLRESWSTLDLDRRQAIIRAIVDRIRVDPLPPGAPRTFDPRRVKITWRL